MITFFDVLSLKKNYLVLFFLCWRVCLLTVYFSFFTYNELRTFLLLEDKKHASFLCRDTDEKGKRSARRKPSRHCVKGDTFTHYISLFFMFFSPVLFLDFHHFDLLNWSNYYKVTVNYTWLISGRLTLLLKNYCLLNIYCLFF